MRMQPRSMFGAIAVGMLIAVGLIGEALAQSADPPGRVAQLSYLDGSVSLEPAGTRTWTSAELNRPLTVGDKLWADQNSRAELDIGDAVIRLGSTTGVSFLNLDDQTTQLQVTAGTVIVHVLTLADGENEEIDTPNLALTLQQPGIYRVEVSESGDTTIVKVDEGEALASGGGQSYPVAAQQSVTFTGTNTLAADYAMLGAPDSLDDWSMQRDRQLQQQAAAAQEYVPPGTVGAETLGSYGTWQDTPDWGYAWFPTVAVGWAPYSLGNWAWISPWGWTWVDEEPWGFAPFHYGRWGYWHHRWCWVPGPRRLHPIYAPALVAWVGGRHAGVSRTTGAHVGWFALGPRDVYVPGYPASAAYVRNINIANTRILNTADIANAYQGRAENVRYVNGGVPGAIIAVPRNVFTSAQPVGPHRLILPHGSAVNLRASTAAPAIIPLRQSVLGGRAGRIVKAPPRALIDRPVVARLAPPRAPVSFAREQAAIRANGGRPLSLTQLSRMRPYTPAAIVRLASQKRGAPAVRIMSARERALEQPTPTPARPLRDDRPPWAQARPLEPRTPMEHMTPERQVPRQQPAPQERFAPPERQIPEQRFAPPERAMPQPRFAAPSPPRSSPPPASHESSARPPEPRSQDRPPP
ncbi:MAG: DUF6600 domain-containing protein [Steroidobacteraceae bacterium]